MYLRVLFYRLICVYAFLGNDFVSRETHRGMRRFSICLFQSVSAVYWLYLQAMKQSFVARTVCCVVHLLLRLRTGLRLTKVLFAKEQWMEIPDK